MITTVISYILLGLSLSVPVGAITIEMIKRGFKNGFLHGWLVGVGGMTADIVLMFLIYFGLAQYLTALIAKLIMLIFGCIILIYLGIESIRDAFKEVWIGEDKRAEPLSRSFLSGFLIAISNPMNIIFWIGIYGSVLTSTINKLGSKESLLYSSAIFVGIAMWDLFVASAVHYSKRILKGNFFKWLTVVAGIALIGFGIHFAYQAWHMLF